ncbi:proteasome maturation factor UMP1 [Piedraia hortae CBS 480.64]|uniref:Proteasome maturation factor UMP1 n=1 Tax=Piedraia hortae CBS 480.64 TaxID=1314780 RepID=A0A6A7BV93_9PEZI|nr:proteasome maturation factor UMP1 [Piedraia hortae CBS 480.64]
MSSNLKIVPPAHYPTTTSPFKFAPSAPGVQDSLRTTVANPTQPTSTHPLESRLKQWRAQQDALKMELLRRQFGIAEPVRRAVELNIVRAGEGVVCKELGGSSKVHEEILMGREAEVDWEDVYPGEVQEGFRREMEGLMGVRI